MDSSIWVWRGMEIDEKGLENRLFLYFNNKPYTAI